MIKTVLPLSFIVGTRFFGLFIVLPVLSLYSFELNGADEFLVGLLVGLYALAQMLLQVPFGILSDKIGRKKALLIGLIIFIIGSLICSNTNDIYTMMMGRTLQGAGAIGAVATAMISDFIVEEQRSKAMAIMGSFIGLAFALSMLLAPIMSAKWGLSSLFDLSALLSFLCIIMLFTIVPKEMNIKHENTKTPIKKFFLERNFFIMNLTNFMQKMLMSIAFFSIPILLVNVFGHADDELWVIYTSAMILGFLAMGFAGAFGEKRGFAKQLLVIGVFFFILYWLASFSSIYMMNHAINNLTGDRTLVIESIEQSLNVFSSSFYIFLASVLIFFIGFNIHEPIMQSCASKFAKANEKGVALGVFNSFGYFGGFVGGIFAGLVFKFNLAQEAFILVLLALLLWFIFLFLLKNPKDFKNIYLQDRDIDLKKLQNIVGVIDSYKNSKNLVIKFDSKITNKEDILKQIKA